jgi:hypothetical protein
MMWPNLSVDTDAHRRSLGGKARDQNAADGRVSFIGVVWRLQFQN